MGDGSKTYTYNTGGRLAGVSWGGNTVSYGINGLGQRVTKSGSGVITGGTHYVYDDAGHLLGEYDVGGAFLKEYLWLGDTPVGVVSPGAVAGAIEVSQVHSDHLDTPRAVVSAGGVVRWRWDGEPFGATAANADADGDGTPYAFNLRFAGQYFDQETNLHYNTFRDYDPATGRYVQSDPIGLAGGINTYGYVEGNPVSKIDPMGLATYICQRPLGGNPGSWAPPVLNHTYACVGSDPNNMSCGSTTASTQGIWPNVKEGSPGVPTTPNKDYYHPDACEKRWDEDSCIETCVANALKDPKRPWYAVGPLGDDCQEYTANIVETCERRCSRR